MWNKKNSLVNRVTSGAMACMMAALTVMNPLATLPVYATQNLIDLDYKSVAKEDVEIYVQSFGESFEPGSDVEMKITIQNNTDKTLTKGGLSWRDNKDVLEDKAFVLLDDQDTEEEISEIAINEKGVVTNITLKPGAVYEVGFTATVDSSLELYNKRTIGFFFGSENAEDADEKITRAAEFDFTTGLVTLLPVEFEDDVNEVAAGTTGSMTLRLALDSSEYVYDVTADTLASDSNAEEEATDSDADEEAEVASGSDAEEAEVASDSDAEEEIATDSNSDEEAETATDSNTDEDVDVATDSGSDEEEDEDEDDEYQLDLDKINFDVVTYGVEFKDVAIVNAVMNESMNEVATTIEYSVDTETEIGSYFGKVGAEVKLDGKSYYATQGFEVVVVESEQKLTAAQLAEVQSVIDLIAHLPTMDEYFVEIEKFFLDDDTMDEEGFNAYIYELAKIAIPAFEAYQALSDEQKALIPAADVEKLEFIYGLCEGVTLELNAENLPTFIVKATANDQGVGGIDSTITGSEDVVVYIYVVDESGNRIVVDSDAENPEYIDMSERRELYAKSNTFLDMSELVSYFSVDELVFEGAYIEEKIGENAGQKTEIDSFNWNGVRGEDTEIAGNYGWRYRFFDDNNDIKYGSFPRLVSDSTDPKYYAVAELYLEFHDFRSNFSSAKENTKIHLFNYGSQINESDDAKLRFLGDTGDHDMTSATETGYHKSSRDVLQSRDNGLVDGKPKMSPVLGEDGYPKILDSNISDETITNAGSLKYLFDKNSDFVTTNASNSASAYDPTVSTEYVSKHFAIKNENGEGTGLFWKDDEGYLVFDSAEHRAVYNPDTKQFVLYDYALRPYYGSENFRGQGHFLPFNYNVSNAVQITDENCTLTTDKATLIAAHLGTNENGTDFAAKMQAYATANPGLAQVAKNVWVLPEVNTKNSRLDEQADYYYGMSVEFDFYQPKGGVVGEEDMIFDFLGDDDVWVYIDDVLVLNIGGTHNPMVGNINFATGDVNQPDAKSDKGTDALVSSNLRTIFENSGKYTDAEISEMFGDGNTFVDYSSHNLKFFYMERGAGSANCRLRFNIPTLPENSLTITKEVTSDLDVIENTVFFPYRVMKADVDGNRTSDLFIPAGTSYDIWENGVDTGEDGVVDNNGYFYLKHGQSAVFQNMMNMFDGAETTDYFVEEVLSNSEEAQYSFVKYSVNGSTFTEATESVEGVHATSKIAPDTTQQVVFRNNAKTPLGELKITKEATAGSNYSSDQIFEVQVKLGETEDKQGIGENAGNMQLLPVGTKYSIDGTEKVVEEAGIIELKIGETATITEGILHGTDYEVIEITPDGSDYHEVYSGTVTPVDGEETQIANSSNGITGTYNMGDKVHITVTNSDYDFAVEIPISKEYVGNTTEENLIFNVYEVQNSNGIWTEKGDLVKNISLSVDDSKVINGTIFIGYENEVAAGTTYYYKVSEVSGSRTDAVYDATYYIVKVTIAENGGIKSASITNILKNGEEEIAANGTLAFVNYATTSISVSKVVTGNLGDWDKEFNFTISVKVGGVDYTNHTLKKGSESLTSNKTFTLANGQSIIVENVPINAIVEVTEANGDYEASIKVNNAEVSDGDTSEESAKVTFTAQMGTNVVFTNHKEAPIDTGILLDSAPYLLTLAIALGGMAIYVINKRKKEDEID